MAAQQRYAPLSKISGTVVAIAVLSVGALSLFSTRTLPSGEHYWQGQVEKIQKEYVETQNNTLKRLHHAQTQLTNAAPRATPVPVSDPSSWGHIPDPDATPTPLPAVNNPDVRTASRQQIDAVRQRLAQERDEAAHAKENPDWERWPVHWSELDKAILRDSEWIRQWDKREWLKSRGFPPEWSTKESLL